MNFRSTVILAPGPSLIVEDVEACRGKANIIAVNDAWRLAPWADALYAADPCWWDHYQGVPDFSGDKWTQSMEAADRWALKYIPCRQRLGLSLDRACIHSGWNSGYQALNLAVLFGAKRIFLLGFDMQEAIDKAHFFGNHPEALQKRSTYSAFIRAFETTTPDLKRAGCAVINCTRQSALSCFPKRSIEEEILMV